LSSNQQKTDFALDINSFVRILAGGMGRMINNIDMTARAVNYKYFGQNIKKAVIGDEIDCREGAKMVLLRSGQTERDITFLLFGGQGCGGIRDVLEYRGGMLQLK